MDRAVALPPPGGAPGGAAPWPVVALPTPPPDPAAERRLEALLAREVEEAAARVAARPFGARVRSGWAPGPLLLYEDHCPIALETGATSHPFSYRCSALARLGDLLLLDGARDPAFERYRCGLPGLEPLDVLSLERGPRIPARGGPPRPGSLAAAALRHPGLLPWASWRAGPDAPPLTLVPYLADGACWRLAQHLAEATCAEVLVAAPPPWLSRRANDKLWFAERVRALLGPHATPPTWSTHGLAAATARMLELARSHATVVTKVPDSGGGRGNLCWRAETLRALGPRGLYLALEERLRDVGWGGRLPLLVGVWEAGVRSSPSVQCWIPPAGAGPPAVQGVFVQQVADPEARFVGASPARLSAPILARLVGEASLLARSLQGLGYAGPCSFDAVLLGGPRTGLRWIECNARWTAVSLPLVLANRLFGDWRTRPFVVVNRPRQATPVGGMEGLLERWGELLLRPGSPEGLVILSPPDGAPGQRGRGLIFLAAAGTIPAARALAARALRRSTEGSRGGGTAGG